MPGWDCLRDRAGGFSAASAAIFFAARLFVPPPVFIRFLDGRSKTEQPRRRLIHSGTPCSVWNAFSGLVCWARLLP
jgi:hypothetical protein